MNWHHTVMAALAVAGCAAATPRVETVQSVAQCPLQRPAVDGADVLVIQDAVQWKSTLKPQAEALLGRRIIWDDERVVVFMLGLQPTLGVRVELASPSLSVKDSVLRVPVKVQRPGPDQMAAMALSWPCVIAAVPRSGWTQVLVTDERGEVLAASATKGP
jgi:hypothetical protein